tara:strand:- start:233 stop:703 length:471 start_codon:yes stop_codon:yes gene_type:complete
MKGSILVSQAYAQGKMLDNSKWGSVLPRGITPSDCDMQMYDNNGNILLVEFSSQNVSWSELSKGQRWGYESMVKLGANSDSVCLAILCKHRISTDQQICTHDAVDWFSVMLPAKSGGVVTTYKPLSGDRWPKFVVSFFEDPKATRAFVYSHIKRGN